MVPPIVSAFYSTSAFLALSPIPFLSLFFRKKLIPLAVISTISLSLLGFIQSRICTRKRSGAGWLRFAANYLGSSLVVGTAAFCMGRITTRFGE